MESMWWTEDEEKLQQQAQEAWDLFPPEDIADPAGDLADLEDIANPAGDLADLEDAMAGLMAEPARPNNNGDVLAFQWHVPEGMLLPVIAPELPMVNGYHIFLPPLNPPHGEAD